MILVVMTKIIFIGESSCKLQEPKGNVLETDKRLGGNVLPYIILVHYSMFV